MFKVNEELNIRKEKKIRDAIHDVVMELDKDEYYDLGVLSNALREDFNIFITPNLLERFFTLWEDDKDSIFNSDDSKWLIWDGKEKFVQNARKNKKYKARLGKSRRRLRQEEIDAKIKGIKKTGWTKLSDNRFVYKGTKSFKIEDSDKVTISKYEKDKYDDGENPITPELLRELLVLNHPDEAIEISNVIKQAIDDKKIRTSPKNGHRYYYECFRYLNNMVKEHKLDYVRNWVEKYGPKILKEGQIRKRKRAEYEKKRIEDTLVHIITDDNKKDVEEELYKKISPSSRYYLLVTKFNKTKKNYMIKKIIHGFIMISDDKYDDGYYKIVLRDRYDGEDIIFFDTIKHLEYVMEGGFNTEDGHVYNIIEEDKLDELKIFLTELKRYKGWDEYLDPDIANNLKNDF